MQGRGECVAKESCWLGILVDVLAVWARAGKHTARSVSLHSFDERKAFLRLRRHFDSLTTGARILAGSERR